LIVIAPSPARDFEKRRWDKWAELADRILEEQNTEIYFIGTLKQGEYIETVELQMKHHRRSFNLCGCHDIEEIPGVIKECDLLITVNTFTMHLGIALGVPTVAIIGGTPAEVVAPKNNPKFRYVENVDNINAITVDEVMEKVDELLGD
jgi:ADP-heptose:LPS heptosyltransferase